VNLLYRPLFLADVKECADYPVSEAGETVAVARCESLKKALQHIQKTPPIGRLRPNLPVRGIRTLNLRKHPNYLVFYRIEKGKIDLLRVCHGMLNLPELFSGTSSPWHGPRLHPRRFHLSFLS
jgi:plasmid stabilization system protein ParE